MKKLKLFFALFAMLALGVTNAWGAEEYALYSGTITEGDYIIVSEGNAMNNTVTSSRLGNTAVTITSDKISNPDAAIIWHIAPSGSYWTIYNAKVNKYAAGTGAKNKAQLLASGTDNKSLWTVTGSETYEFVNKANAAANVNMNLRRNGTYGFACYATSTGKALSLYKKVEQSGGETPDPTPVTISLNKTELNLQAGATESLTATVTGSTESVTWSSSATGVASVDNTGKVTAVAAGNATITAAIGDVKATCAVTVTAAITPEEPGTGGEETWTLVTNASDLKAGNQIVIAASASNYALGTTQNTNNRAAVSVTKGTNTITIGDDVQIITLETGKVANTFAFNTGSAGYLYAASSTANNLKTKTTLDDNGSWAISITSAGVATIQAKGTNTRNLLKKNSSSALFSCYGSGQSDVAIYKKVTSTDEPGTEETDASLTANPTTIDFGTKNIYFDSEKKGSLEIEVTGQNLTGNVTAAISGNDATKFKLSSSSLTHNAGSVSEKLTVSYEVSEEKEYSATLTLSSDGIDNVELPITLKVINKEPATYVKVTNAVTDGDYLIVYEDATAPVAFNGALTTLDAVSNTVGVEINNNIIVGNAGIDAATFTIDATAGTIKSANGYYIGQTSDANGLKANTSTKYENALSIENDGTATIKSGGAYLRYNSATNNWRFRYYKSSSYTDQKAIALYKKASKHTVTIADCTNGSVSADVISGATVLSETTITLNNTPTTGYKLAAYDVYKTGEESTKVTVTDGKFIMPEFDVTISATFELAKTLTGIEITTPATQTTFWQGETFNSTGLKVTAHFDGAADEDVTDKVTVTGSTATAGTQTVTVSFKEGEVTKTTTYNITVKAIPNTKETAYTVADAFDIIDKLTTANGVFIKGIVSQVDEYLSSYKSITYWISDDGTTTKQLQAYSGKGLDRADFTDINGISVDDQVIICGNLKKYSGTYEFDKNNYLAEHTKTTKADPELSYTTTEYNVNLGDAFTAPTLNNPNTLAVTYSSNNEDVATVAADGAVTIKAAGTVKITASFAGNDDYVAGSASYTINVTDPNQLEVTFDATQDLDDDNATKGAGKITKTPITFACTDGILGSSTYGHYRIYANAKATFSAAEGYIITKVVLTSTASGTSDYGPAKLSAEDGTYTYNGKEGTWVGEAYTVTLTATAQTRATLITVYYKQDNRVDAGLAWNPATISLTVGDAFTAPTFSNPNRLTVSFESSNSELATVNNAGVISLVSGKTGTATITATFVGTETYKPAEVTCIISVNPKTEDVVIVAQQGGKWYALKAEDLDGANKTMAALEVEYINGVVYNLSDAEKTAITWERAVIGNQVTFKHGDKYLFGTSGSTDLKLNTTSCDWTYDGAFYKVGNRTFLYRAQATGFKNYATTNIGNDDYAARLVVTAAKFENATIIKRSDLTAGNFGTICYKNNITNFTGATFYEVAGKEGRKVIFDEVTELVAGMPYIFRAEAAELKIVLGQETATTAGQHKSLQGTFEKIEDGEAGEAGNTLEGNYIIYNNFIKKCGAKCGLLENRAYFIADALNNLTAPVSPAPGRKRVSMDVLGENEATGVDNITENGVIAPAMQGTYDVLGRQLSEPTATGFYIVNGKKVFVVK